MNAGTALALTERSASDDDLGRMAVWAIAIVLGLLVFGIVLRLDRRLSSD